MVVDSLESPLFADALEVVDVTLTALGQAHRLYADAKAEEETLDVEGNVDALDALGARSRNPCAATRERIREVCPHGLLEALGEDPRQIVRVLPLLTCRRRGGRRRNRVELETEIEGHGI